MSSVAETRVTPEEYLRRERAAETKSEYDDGVVYAMSGAGVEHFRRGVDQWLYTVARGLDATLPLPAAQCELPLGEIYYQVVLA